MLERAESSDRCQDVPECPRRGDELHLDHPRPDLTNLLSRLRLAGFKINFEATTPLYLPRFPGSLLRGILGHALRERLCQTGAPDCKGCDVAQECEFPFLFETASRRWESPRYQVPSPPFVLVPPSPASRRLAPGQTFCCGLTLFGRAIRRLPVFYEALQGLAGYEMGPARGRVRLVGIENDTGSEMLPLLDEGSWLGREVTVLTASDLLPNCRDPVRRLRLRFLTPLRMKHRGRFIRGPQLDFHILLLRLLERIESLLQSFEGVRVKLGHGLLEAASAVSLEASTLRWVDPRRFSNRQQRSMRLGGLLGAVEYRGDLTPFMPVFWLGARCHIGKQAAFGLGRYRAEICQEESPL